MDDLPDALGMWREGGLVTGPFDDAAVAMAEADRIVAAQLCGEDQSPD